MIDDTIEHLIWQDIDGTIDPADRESLHARLSDDPEAQRCYDDFIRLARLLDGVDDVEPPTILRKRILDSLAGEQPDRAGSGILDLVRRFWGGAWQPRLALAAAAGFLIGIIGYHLVKYEANGGGAVDFTNLRATMGSHSRTFAIDAEGVRGTLRLQRHPSLIKSELNIRSDGEIEVRLEHNGEVQFGGRERTSGPSTNRISVENHGISIVNRGEGTYYMIVELRGGTGGPLVVRIMSGGRVVYDQSIDPDSIPGV